MSNQKKADAAFVVVTFFWGVANTVSEYAMRVIAPMQLNAARFIVAFAVSYLFLMRGRIKGISKATWKSSAVLGLLLSAVYVCAMYGILNARSVTTYGFIIAMPVVLNPIINFIFRGIVPNKKFFISLVLSVAGLYLMTMQGGRFSLGIGEIFALFSAIFYSIDICYTDAVVSKEKADPKEMGVLQIGFAAVFMTAISLVIDRGQRFVLSWDIAACILFLAIGATALAFIVQPIAQQYTSSNHVGIIFTLEPVFSALTAVIVLHETVSPTALAGAALMIIAVVLMNIETGGKRAHGNQ